MGASLGGVFNFPCYSPPGRLVMFCGSPSLLLFSFYSLLFVCLLPGCPLEASSIRRCKGKGGDRWYGDHFGSKHCDTFTESSETFGQRDTHGLIRESESISVKEASPVPLDSAFAFPKYHYSVGRKRSMKSLIISRDGTVVWFRLLSSRRCCLRDRLNMCSSAAIISTFSKLI